MPNGTTLSELFMLLITHCALMSPILCSKSQYDGNMYSIPIDNSHCVSVKDQFLLKSILAT